MIVIETLSSRSRFLSFALAGLLWLIAAAPSLAADQPASVDAIALEQRISKLVEQLGDDQFAVRQRAQQELIKLGYAAFDALSDAENSDDPEIAAQAGYLVRLIRVEWTRDSDPRPIQQILKNYETQSDERRLLVIRQLAELPED